jgi:hypothetical protein
VVLSGYPHASYDDALKAGTARSARRWPTGPSPVPKSSGSTPRRGSGTCQRPIPAGDNVIARMNKVMRKYHGHLVTEKASVGVLMARNEDGEAVKVGGYPCAALVRKVSLKDRAAGLPDAQIIIDEIRWEDLDDAERTRCSTTSSSTSRSPRTRTASRSGTTSTGRSSTSPSTTRRSGSSGASSNATGRRRWTRRSPRSSLRVAKPGAMLLAFGGTRTFHRLTCAIEDAGWEIRDCMSWLYGSGFPKSLDISKAIDKAAGAEREVVGGGKPVKRMIPGADQNANRIMDQRQRAGVRRRK